jgi:hypothetical protein
MDYVTEKRSREKRFIKLTHPARVFNSLTEWLSRVPLPQQRAHLHADEQNHERVQYQHLVVGAGVYDHLRHLVGVVQTRVQKLDSRVEREMGPELHVNVLVCAAAEVRPVQQVGVQVHQASQLQQPANHDTQTPPVHPREELAKGARARHSVGDSLEALDLCLGLVAKHV